MHAVPSLVIKLLFKWRHGNVIPQRDLCSIIPDPCLSMSYDLLSNEARVRLLVVISSWGDVHNCDIVYFIFSVMCQIRDIILCKDVYMVGKINDKPNTCRAFVLQLYSVSLYIYMLTISLSASFPYDCAICCKWSRGIYFSIPIYIISVVIKKHTI